MYKIEIIAPWATYNKIQDALLEAGAGDIGNYSGCLTHYGVIGSWIPQDGSHPSIGNNGERCFEHEIKIEVNTEDPKSVVKAVKAVQLSEEFIINVFKLETDF